MKMFLISDNTDTLVGMKLAGVEGVVVHNADEAIKETKKVVANEEYGIILITSKLKEQANEFFSRYLEKHTRPLFLEIPDRHGFSRSGSSIGDFIEKSIGVKLNNQNGGEKKNG